MHIANDPRAVRIVHPCRLDVDAGRVGCPFRGDVDIEACFACGYLVTVEGDRPARVVCARPFEELPGVR